MANITVSNDIDTFLQAANNAAAKSALGISDSNWENVSTNAVELRDGTTATEGYLYNTYTDASNYERGFLKWDTNEFVIGTENLGTGTARNLRLATSGVFKVSNLANTDTFINLSGYIRIGIGTVLSTYTGTGIVIGNQARVEQTAYSGVAIGDVAVCAAGNHSVALGATTVAKGAGSVALGGAGLWGGSVAYRTAEIGFPIYYNTKAYHGFQFLTVQTTDSNPKAFLTSNGGNYPIVLTTNRTYTFNGVILAQKSDYTQNASWRVSGLIKNVSGTVSLVGSTVEVIASDNSDAWSIAVEADNTNKCLKIILTAEDTVNAHASIHFIEASATTVRV